MGTISPIVQCLRGPQLPTAMLVIALAYAAAVVASTPAFSASRHAAMVIDMNTGQTLFNEQGDEPRFPASLTKMMTIYLVFEQIEAGRLMPWTKLKVSAEAAAAAPTKLDLDPGEQISVMDAIKSLITKSANDMAIVLAEAVGGTEVKFAELMTQKALALGMSRTTFRNASGLPDAGQVTTARDMLTLAMRLQDDFPKQFPLFATKAFFYDGASHRNHNTLLGTFEGVDGIKTGYTRMSGFNLVTSLRRGEKHLVAAVFGGATAGTRNVTMRTILTRSLLKASTKKTRKPVPILVARTKPAVRPPVVTASLPATVAEKPKPAAQPAAKPPESRPADVESSETDREAAPTEPNNAAPAFTYEVAKVRPVMVAVRARPIAPPVPTAASAGFIAPEPAAPVLQPSRPGATAIDTTSPPAPSAAVRGALPSTLQAQARELLVARASVGPPAIRQEATPPSKPIPATAGAGFHVQIGAFGTAAEAERVLQNTRNKSNGLLASATPITTPVQKENRQLYRARFAGFDAKAAATTCQELRRLTIDCFVMKAD